MLPCCRAFEDEGKARLGVVECAKHELLQPFSVLSEKEGEDLHCLRFSLTLLHFYFSLSSCHSKIDVKMESVVFLLSP